MWFDSRGGSRTRGMPASRTSKKPNAGRLAAQDQGTTRALRDQRPGYWLFREQRPRG
jgi:hypothetical protein